MSQLMLVNPRRRKHRRHRHVSVTARRNPRRKARKMSAAQAKYFAPKRKRRSRARHHVTVSARRNPRHVRRHRRARGLAGFARSTSGSMSIQGLVIPSAIGAAGALGLDVIYGYLPIPANLKAGTFAPLVKLAAVIGISALAAKFLPRQRALVKQAVGAAVTISAYNFLKAQVQQRMPSVPLGEYVSGYISGYSSQGGFPELGYVSPAQAFPDVQPTHMSGVMPWGDPGYQDEIF